MFTPTREPIEVPAGQATRFAALGDETRLAIVSRLAAGSALSIIDLTQGTAMTRQAVTKHLGVLEAAGLVHSTRHGRSHLFALAPEHFRDMTDYLDRVSRQWDAALARLKAHIENDEAR